MQEFFTRLFQSYYNYILVRICFVQIKYVFCVQLSTCTIKQGHEIECEDDEIPLVLNEGDELVADLLIDEDFCFGQPESCAFSLSQIDLFTDVASLNGTISIANVTNLESFAIDIDDFKITGSVLFESNEHLTSVNLTGVASVGAMEEPIVIFIT